MNSYILIVTCNFHWWKNSMLVWSCKKWQVPDFPPTEDRRRWCYILLSGSKILSHKLFIPVITLADNSATTEYSFRGIQVGLWGNTFYLYSGGNHLKSWLGHWQSWLSLFIGFFTHFRKKPGLVPQIRPWLLLYISFPVNSSSHPVIWCCIV